MNRAEKAKLVKGALAEINKIRVEWGAKRIRRIRKGVRFLSGDCPVAVSLSEGTGRKVVTSQGRIIWWPENAKPKTLALAKGMPTPPMIAEFITKFDSDEFPEYLFDPWAIKESA